MRQEVRRGHALWLGPSSLCWDPCSPQGSPQGCPTGFHFRCAPGTLSPSQLPSLGRRLGSHGDRCFNGESRGEEKAVSVFGVPSAGHLCACKKRLGPASLLNEGLQSQGLLGEFSDDLRQFLVTSKPALLYKVIAFVSLLGKSRELFS